MEHVIETAALDDAVKSGKTVRMIFNTGYQTDAVILGHDKNTISCSVHGKYWLVYKRNVSTIVFE